MIYNSRRWLGEFLIVFLTGALFLYSLYSAIRYGGNLWIFALVMAVIAGGLLFFYVFPTEYEMTDTELVIREHKPFRSRSIPYAEIYKCVIGGRERDNRRTGRKNEIYVYYRREGKEQLQIVSPELQDNFVRDLERVCGRSLKG